MGQILSAVCFRSASVNNHLRTGKGQTTQAAAGRDTPVSCATSEPFMSNITENDVNPGKQHPSSNLTADLGATQARQVSVGGGTPAQGEHQTFALVTSNIKENDVIPSEQPHSNLSSDLSAVLGAPQARQEPVGGGTPAQGKHQTFALVIGINEYKFIEPKQDLKCAVKDTDNFKNYLLEDLGVAADNIIDPRDEKATRSAIINQFRQLEGDLKIVPGEVAIIIYFAGHGALATKPDEWSDWVSTDKNIEMLCPANIGALDANGNVIEGIPDRTISRLLLDLSIAKGNNITLILDCCHAAGINRGASEDSRVRNFKNHQSLSPSCDEDIYSREYGTRLYQDKKSGFSNSVWGSHILLAACRCDQSAWEEGEQGIFTSALLKALKQFASRGLSPMYDSLMNCLSMPDQSQTPQWDGKHIHRRLFDSWQTPADSFMIRCYKVKSATDYLILFARSLHGITENSTFEIFKPDSIHPDKTNPLAVLTVTQVQDHVSHLLLTPPYSSLFDLPDNERRYWHARLEKASGPPELNVYCNDLGVLDSILNENSESRITAALRRVTNSDHADLCLMVKKKDVSIDIGKSLRAKIEFPSDFPPYTMRINHSPSPISSVTDI